MIREAKLEDVAAMRSIYAPFVESSAVSFEEETPSVEAFAQRLHTYQAESPWLVASDGERLLGFAYASPHRARGAYRWNAEVSAYVATNARRRGIARALYTSLFALLRLQSRYRALAGIVLPNDASCALHGSMGFDPVGTYDDIGFKHGSWHAVQWWAKPLLPCLGPPLPLRSPAELRDTDAWRRAIARGSDRIGAIDLQLSRFECCELGPEIFNHEQHVRCAAAMVCRYPFDEALQRIREGIQRLNHTHGVVTTDTRGYHETLTRAWLVLVAGDLARGSLDDAAGGNGDGERRLTSVARNLSDKQIMLRHYSKERILSREARYGWLEPDLERLPEVPDAFRAGAFFPDALGPPRPARNSS